MNDSLDEKNTRAQPKPYSDRRAQVEDEKSVIVDDNTIRPSIEDKDYLHLNPIVTASTEHRGHPLGRFISPSQAREEAHRLDDELALFKVERQISEAAKTREAAEKSDGSERDSIERIRSKRNDEVDEFDISTEPVHQTAQIYNAPNDPATRT